MYIQFWMQIEYLMKEVTFRTDFPHAVKSQAQKQLRETYLCLEGGGGGGSGREEGGGKGEIKRGGNFRKKCFPEKWFGVSCSSDSALVPVEREWKLLWWGAAVFSWMVSISPSSGFSLVILCHSCYHAI